VDGKAIHQVIDYLPGIIVRAGGQMGIFGGGQEGVMTEDFLDFEEADAGFDQMSGITMPQTVWGNLFLFHSRPLPGVEWSARRHDRADCWRDEPLLGHRGDWGTAA